ncbi:MAG TPA: CoB--CoM heterodisulfide reductase iron-sulfur subunit A family protein [Deltaproteobacteria bacterium]|nr:CoB--CoM heterodisulfide reductase iron-sulfur subunit A family protein [Deltaproteobacteria bacterium]
MSAADKKKPGSKVGAVLVVGGGIAGTQAALDLADSGYFVYLIEKSSAIGGVMAQLDKTFPTNDCSMCILSPKLVECGRHLNIEVITLADVEEVKGEAGNFSVKIRQRPRYIDVTKCIACGRCAEKCPRKVIDEFNEGLNFRKAAYVKYPQAVPLKYAIDEANCIYFEKGKCKACQKFCPAEAVDFDQKEEVFELNVGAVILAPGFEEFNPEVYDTYGFSRYPNVVTSTQFERILSASGPYEGHLLRPSDKTEPKKIAWLQCVGSRDLHKAAKGYCSGVCCMYAIKEAVIAKEHATEPVDTAIFFMDMRTYGKDFERYYNRAKEEIGIRFIRCRIHTLAEVPETKDIIITYVNENGELESEVFNLVVLSVGLEISEEMEELAKRLGVEVDFDGFAETSSFSPVATSRDGIFVCGAFNGPKDIPYSVMEASAAAAASEVTLAEVRGTLTKTKSYPEEVPVSGEEPRIGVFVCNCGINIGSVVKVPEVVEYAKTLPYVVYAGENLFTCSQDTQENIVNTIKEHKLNRVVVAACTPRTHEPLFQETLREAGLNRFLFEMANIRDQDSWVHSSEPEKATEKAKDLVRMAVAKAALLEPVEEIKVKLSQQALVVGGGVSGMVAALTLADQGYKTYLVEKNDRLGGQALHLKKTWKGEDIQEYLKDLISKINDHPKIEVLLNSRVVDVEGFVGNFNSTIRNGNSERTINHGVAILATGAESLEPDEYLYGKSDRVFRWHELDEAIEKNPQMVENARCAVFIQCVGSREPDRPYCSKICCTAAIQKALELKELNPDMDVFVLYRDLRTYGRREELYTEARQKGIIFIRYTLENKPVVEEITTDDGRQVLKVTVIDHVLQMPVALEANFIHLATAIYPTDHEDLARFFKVTLNQDNFFLEAHMKLRPVDFATDGVYVCGLAHYPKPIEESIAQAQAAAARAAIILQKEEMTVEPIVSVVDQEKCIGCGLCTNLCPFGAIRLIEVAGKGYRAENISASCKGCGICAASCPEKAIDMVHFRDSQIMAAIDALRAESN